MVLTGTVAWLSLAALMAISSGVVNPTSEALSIRRPPGFDAHEAWQRNLSDPSRGAVAVARERLQAVGVVDERVRHFWVPASLDGSTAPRLSNQWLFALTGQWSTSSYRVVDDIWGDDVPVADQLSDPRDAIRRIRSAEPDAVIVVPPELLDRLDDDPEFRDAPLTSW